MEIVEITSGLGLLVGAATLSLVYIQHAGKKARLKAHYLRQDTINRVLRVFVVIRNAGDDDTTVTAMTARADGRAVKVAGEFDGDTKVSLSNYHSFDANRITEITTPFDIEGHRSRVVALDLDGATGTGFDEIVLTVSHSGRVEEIKINGPK